MKNKIGTLSEKSIHSQIKELLQPDKTKQEVNIGNYIADIVDGKDIIEIQTRDFSKLRNKISTYIDLGYNVRIVYPVCTEKYINWLDPDMRNVVERKKSPAKGNVLDVFKELYKLGDMLKIANLTFTVITLSAEEYKLLDGYGPNRKNHCTKLDKIPTSFKSEINFSIRGGYEQFIDKAIGSEFTSADIKRNTRCSIESARMMLLVLYRLGILNRLGKNSQKMYVYTRNF